MREAVILAGGAGTRLRPRVSGLPKTLAPVRGRPFLELLLDYWIAQGISRFILSLGYLAEAVTARFGHEYRGVPLAYAIEENPLGTGGGLLLSASRLLSANPFVALNGDTLFATGLAELEGIPNSEPLAVSLALKRQSAARFSEFVLEGSRIMRILSGPPEGRPRLTNGGVYLFRHPEVLTRSGRSIGESFSLEMELLPRLAQAGALFGQELPGSFIDIGTPDEYDRINEDHAFHPSP